MVQRADLLTTYVVSAMLTDMDEKYFHEKHAIHHILYQSVFCPKWGKKIFGGVGQGRLSQIIEEVTKGKRCQVVEVAIQSGHVHQFKWRNVV